MPACLAHALDDAFLHEARRTGCHVLKENIEVDREALDEIGRLDLAALKRFFHFNGNKLAFRCALAVRERMGLRRCGHRAIVLLSIFSTRHVLLPA